jgi:hypothetical protein
MRFVHIVFFASIFSWSFSIQAANVTQTPSSDQSYFLSDDSSQTRPVFFLEELLEEDDRSEESYSGDQLEPLFSEPTSITSTQLKIVVRDVFVSAVLISDIHVRGPPISQSLS